MKTILGLILISLICYISVKEALIYSRHRTNDKLSEEANKMHRHLLNVIMQTDSVEGIIVLRQALIKMQLVNRRIFPDYEKKNNELNLAYQKKSLEIMNKYHQSIFASQGLIQSFNLN